MSRNRKPDSSSSIDASHWPHTSVQEGTAVQLKAFADLVADNEKKMGDIQNHYDFPAHSQTGNKHSKKQWNTPELPASVLSQNAIHSAVMAMEFEKLIIQSQLHNTAMAQYQMGVAYRQFMTLWIQSQCLQQWQLMNEAMPSSLSLVNSTMTVSPPSSPPPPYHGPHNIKMTKGGKKRTTTTDEESCGEAIGFGAQAKIPRRMKQNINSGDPGNKHKELPVRVQRAATENETRTHVLNAAKPPEIRCETCDSQTNTGKKEHNQLLEALGLTRLTSQQIKGDSQQPPKLDEPVAPMTSGSDDFLLQRFAQEFHEQVFRETFLNNKSGSAAGSVAKHSI